MSYTYLDALTTNRDKVRFAIGNTVENTGPQPARANFTDNQITYALAQETTVNGAAALLFETLTAEWTAYAMSEADGGRSRNATSMANSFRKLAAEWRNKPGGSSAATQTIGVATLTRTDAYTEAASEYSE